ncbi:3-deoxy-D-manno-octulosonic acid transferase [Acidiphilium iwatense]|uniref:3-deoxy-D-manno-octulosonic acid transferase n=1 Tax=Acidiphilium iwatense TaxID=768198 RepID=A0ABS9DTG4_9PROT|nr:3-deoxy-D-manno-octulosonic acid transferase [Acidiphilium iwatense]MCF3946026.1 3-deoxy-D-manno-octulosonic acid transferase [Acidiphilium iwatense]
MPLSLSIYRGVTALTAPLLPFWLSRRAKRGKEIAARLPERYGIASITRPGGRLIWIHAASMGETMSALTLIDILANHAAVLLTTGTITSAGLAARRARAIHQFVPLDAPRYAERFLDHWRPDTAVFVESEIWPNLLRGLDARHVPRFLVNARLSARSAKRWARFPATARALFDGFGFIAAQSEADAAALRGLGIDRVEAPGNLKFAAPLLPDDSAARTALETACPGPRILAASTHAGEDAPMVAAHRALLAGHANLTTIIVPRHPERAEAIAALTAGLPTARRSRGEMPVPGGIYLADTLGELGLFYGFCPIAFIGGSLVPVGGHNMIEAAQLGCAAIAGPHLANFAEAAAILRAAGGLIDITDGTELTQAFDSLLADPARAAMIGEAGRRACQGFADLPARLTAQILDAIA